jgi:hypothetical protein
MLAGYVILKTPPHSIKVDKSRLIDIVRLHRFLITAGILAKVMRYL